MKRDEVRRRLAEAAPRSVPSPDGLLERTFPAEASRAPRSPAIPVAAIAGVALTVAASAPVWVEPSRAERERTGALITAVVKTVEHCARELNPGVSDDG